MTAPPLRRPAVLILSLLVLGGPLAGCGGDRDDETAGTTATQAASGADLRDKLGLPHVVDVNEATGRALALAESLAEFPLSVLRAWRRRSVAMLQSHAAEPFEQAGDERDGAETVPAPETQGRPMPRATTAAWLVIPPRAVKMPRAACMP